MTMPVVYRRLLLFSSVYRGQSGVHAAIVSGGLLCPLDRHRTINMLRRYPMSPVRNLG